MTVVFAWFMLAATVFTIPVVMAWAVADKGCVASALLVLVSIGFEAWVVFAL